MATRLNRYQLVVGGLVVLALLFLATTIILLQIGASYRQRLATQEKALPVEAELDVSRVRLERKGRTIEILPNGTIIITENGISRTALLGFRRLEHLFGDLTLEDLLSFQSSYTDGSGEHYTIIIETSDGQEFEFEIVIDDEELPDELEELIEELEETGNEVGDPTPTPTNTPTPPPGSTPTPTPAPTPTPTPSPTPPPEYSNAPPFTCEDYNFIKDTPVSNVVCSPEE